MLSETTKSTWYSWPIQTWVSVFLALSLLALPLSSTAKSIFIVISLGLIAFSPVYWRDLREQLYQPWCQAAIFLFFIAVIACAWSPATLHDKLREIEKYSKLLYLPVLVVGFRDAQARRLGFYGFLLAMVITVLASILMYTGIYSFRNVEVSGIFRNHIMTSYMVAFAAYLSGFLFFQQRGKASIPYALLVLLFTYHILFINNGRAGTVIFLLLMAMLMFQTFSWRQALLSIVLGCSLISFTYYLSPVMQDAMHRSVNEYMMYKEYQKNTSIGYRFQFHNYAHNLFKRHPWIGNGTSSFTHLYHEENPIPSRGNHLLEPHSQYWLIASEYGILGCLALAFFLGSLLVSSWQLKTLRPLALATLLPFFIGNLSDSLLFYSGTGYFFILFMALCLGEQDRKVG